MSGNHRERSKLILERTPPPPLGPDEPIGRIVRLSDDRIVFVGERTNEEDHVFIGFRNREGVERFLVLSKEAMAALIQCAQPDAPMEVGPFPYKKREQKLVWRVKTEDG